MTNSEINKLNKELEELKLIREANKIERKLFSDTFPELTRKYTYRKGL